VPSFAQANPNVELSEELERAVFRALEKDPEYRYPMMKDFSQALLKTPEGRTARARISSIRDEDVESVAARVENTNYPRSTDGGTAMFGSPGAPGSIDDVEVPTHSSKGMVVGVLLALLALLGGGAYYFAGRDRPSGMADAAPVGLEPPVQEEPPAQRDPEPEPDLALEEAEEADPGEPEAAQKVMLRVSTTPEGGVVKKDGFQVCDAAPCVVAVEAGEAVTLTGEKGTAKGEAKVLAQKDQSVSIQLVAPRVAAPRPAPTPKPSGPTLCEVLVDGIKILRPCE
jgi:hypothetical protein